MTFFPRKNLVARYSRRREGDFTRQVLRGAIRLLLIALFLGLTWYLTRLSTFTIIDVSVEGGETISHDIIRERVESELTGTYFLIVPKRFSYFYPHDRIVEVLEKTPRIHDVALTRLSRSGLHVSFKEYLPYALWCGEDNSASCWFLSEAGYAFAEAPTLQGGTLVRHFFEGKNDLDAGQVLESERLGAIHTFMMRMEDTLGHRVSSAFHRQNGDIEFSVSGGGKVLTSGNRDFDITFENLKTVLESPEFKHLKPGNFQYIDVRFENKVFVNEQLETEVGTTTGTSTLPEED